MNGTRILGAVCAGILATSLGTLVACGGSSDENNSASEVDGAVTAKTVQAATVMVEIADANGLKIGQSSATVIAPRLVLTAGHMIAGQSKWVITTADGKKVTGSKGLTYDWHKYDSDKAHPRLHDVGVIYLDSPIKLDAYPQVVAQTSTVGATRMRGAGGAFAQVGATLGWLAGAPNNYVTQLPLGETLDTGGAVFSKYGIVGVVEGKGLSTGQLHVARTDQLRNWITKKASCAGATTATAFAVGKPKQQICDDAGNPIGNSSSSSGNPGDSTSNGGSGGSGGSGDDGPGQCQSDDTDGIDSKTDEGTSTTGLNDSTGPGGSSRGENGGAGSNGSNGSNGNNGSDGNSSTGSDNSTGNTGSNGSNTGGAGSNGSNTGSNNNGSNSNGSSTGSDGNTNGSNNGTPSGGAGSSSSNSGGSQALPVPSSEPCQGPTDNPETCPPQATGCKGAECGGSFVEPAGIDRGFCMCASQKTNAFWLK